jgi:hypothetical protein
LRWQTKSLIQRAFAKLPVGSGSLYYIAQRYAGQLRGVADPTENFVQTVKLLQSLREARGEGLKGARIMEVGTGWGLDMPIGFFLCGAAFTKTFDAHCHLRRRRVEEALEVIRAKRQLVSNIFLSLTNEDELSERLEKICRVSTLDQLLKAARIEYFAPSDAASTGLQTGSIDVHFSHTVLEHIPEQVLKGILIESCRLLSKHGVAFHHIDPSDHFSHDDSRISKINFLRFSDEEWNRYAGNRFAYHNRLRAVDYLRLFEEYGHRIIRSEIQYDEQSLREIAMGFPLDAKFRGYSGDSLSASVVLIISACATK